MLAFLNITTFIFLKLNSNFEHNRRTAIEHLTAAARLLDGQEARAGKSRFSLKPHPRRPKLISSFSGGCDHYWLLRHVHPCCLHALQ